MRKLIRRSFFFAAVISAMLLGSKVKADSWVFLPSYYSHDPVAPVQIGPRYEGGPYYIRPQGEYVRSGYTHTQTTISVGSQGTDTFNYYESWIQAGGQY
jgi:hypothetical protein